jgi:hypothetical protein
MRPLSLASALTLALLAPVGRAAARPNAIAPGWWETTNQVISPLHSTKVERRCIRPQDVAKFMDGPQNHIYHCTYPTRVVGEGVIRLRGSCASRDGRPFPIAGEGTFSRDTFHVEARASYQFGPLTIPIHAMTDAHRLGADCPAETADPPAAAATAGQTSTTAAP